MTIPLIEEPEAKSFKDISYSRHEYTYNEICKTSDGSSLIHKEPVAIKIRLSLAIRTAFSLNDSSIEKERMRNLACSIYTYLFRSIQRGGMGEYETNGLPRNQL